MDAVDLLAVGAHPDDVELGCGGVIVLAAQAGLRVAVADLTIGEMGTRGTPEDRDQERLAAAEILGLCARPCLHLPDSAVGTDPGHRDRVVELIRDLRPRVVLAPFVEDRHPDHAAAGRLVRDACFVAGLAKVGDGPPHRPAALYHYMLHHPFRPSFVVDVSSTWSRKMEAVMAYTSQFGPPPDVATSTATATAPSTGLLRVFDARDTLHGAMIGAERGEAFTSAGPVPLRMVPGIGDGDGDGDGRQPVYRSFL